MGPLNGLTIVAPGEGGAACGATKPSPPPLSPRSAARTAAALADALRLAFGPLMLFVQMITGLGRSPPKAAKAARCEGDDDETFALASASSSELSLADSYACTPLPLPPPSSPGRLTVCLDLDETLVAVYPSPTPPGAVPGPGPPAPRLTLTADYGDGTEGPVDVFVRPGLHAFLSRLASLPCDVVLFTAGLPGYAGPIADALDPTGALLPARLFRPSTRSAGPVPHTKDLTVLGRDLARTVLLDNSPWSFLLQPGCGVPAAPFAGEGGDGHLVGAVLPLLEALAADPTLDVRPALAARFGMAAWLAGRGGFALFTGPCGNLFVAAETAAEAGKGGTPLGADGAASGRRPAAAAALVSIEA